MTARIFQYAIKDNIKFLHFYMRENFENNNEINRILYTKFIINLRNEGTRMII